MFFFCQEQDNAPRVNNRWNLSRGLDEKVVAVHMQEMFWKYSEDYNWVLWGLKCLAVVLLHILSISVWCVIRKTLLKILLSFLVQIKLVMLLASTSQNVTEYPFTVLNIMRAPRLYRLIPWAPLLPDSCPLPVCMRKKLLISGFNGLLMCKAEVEMVSKGWATR